MSEREEAFAHVVEAWLDTAGEAEDAERVLDAVLEAFPRTPQERPGRLWWPVSTKPRLATLGAACAAVILVTFFATTLLSSQNVLQPSPGEPSNGWIVYSTRPHGAAVPPADLYLVQPGQAERLLVGDGQSNVCPTFSPDGRMLAYLANNELLVFAFDDSGALRQEVLHHPLLGRAAELCPIWAPDGTRLASATSAGITLISLTGDESTVAVDAFTFSVDYPPTWAWSPDGQTIAVATDRGLLLVDLDGAPVRTLVSAVVAGFSWSPDGSRIAVIVPLGGNPIRAELRVIRLYGDAPDVVLGDGGVWASPLWAPSGNSIAYLAGDCGLNIIQADGSGSRTSNGDCYYSLGPWSPDGQWVLHMLDIGGAWQLGASSAATLDETNIIVPWIGTPSARSWPGFPGDVSWQVRYLAPAPSNP